MRIRKYHKDVLSLFVARLAYFNIECFRAQVFNLVLKYRFIPSNPHSFNRSTKSHISLLKMDLNSSCIISVTPC